MDNQISQSEPENHDIDSLLESIVMSSDGEIDIPEDLLALFSTEKKVDPENVKRINHLFQQLFRDGAYNQSSLFIEIFDELREQIVNVQLDNNAEETLNGLRYFMNSRSEPEVKDRVIFAGITTFAYLIVCYALMFNEALGSDSWKILMSTFTLAYYIVYPRLTILNPKIRSKFIIRDFLDHNDLYKVKSKNEFTDPEEM